MAEKPVRMARQGTMEGRGGAGSDGCSRWSRRQRSSELSRTTRACSSYCLDEEWRRDIQTKSRGLAQFFHSAEESKRGQRKLSWHGSTAAREESGQYSGTKPQVCKCASVQMGKVSKVDKAAALRSKEH